MKYLKRFEKFRFADPAVAPEPDTKPAPAEPGTRPEKPTKPSPPGKPITTPSIDPGPLAEKDVVKRLKKELNKTGVDINDFVEKNKKD